MFVESTIKCGANRVLHRHFGDMWDDAWDLLRGKGLGLHDPRGPAASLNLSSDAMARENPE